MTLQYSHNSSSQFDDWRRALMLQMPGLRRENGMLLCDAVCEGEVPCGNIDYESISRDPFRTIAAEYPFYLAALTNAVSQLASRETAVIGDFGCGDGRFTLHLLKNGTARIVAMDLSSLNLRRLQARVRETPDGEGRVLLVQGDVADPLLPAESLDLILVIGVLPCVDDMPSTVRRLAERLKPAGLLLTVDPTELGAAIYAIVRHDEAELAKVLGEGTKSVDIADPNSLRTRVRDVRQLAAAHEAAGLQVVSTTGIPLFPSLIFGALKQARPHTQAELEQLKAMNDALTARYPNEWRAACILSRRPPRTS